MSKHSYTIIYQSIPPEEGSGFYAHVPALGITSDGETIDEAKEMALDAIEGYIEGLQAIGKSVPQEYRAERVEVGE
jgi:predicted RNase H-like HicB family nuclease